jgi:hypothetical protein
MSTRREFRFSQAGFSLYALFDEGEGSGGGVRYVVMNGHDEPMDELPSLGQASALMATLAQRSQLKDAPDNGAGSRLN